MLEAVHTDLVFTISLKRSTQNLQLSTSSPADYPIFWGKADMETNDQLDKEPAVVIRKPNVAMHRAPQHDQLMSECRVLGFEAAFRFKWCGHDGQHEP